MYEIRKMQEPFLKELLAFEPLGLSVIDPNRNRIEKFLKVREEEGLRPFLIFYLASVQRKAYKFLLSRSISTEELFSSLSSLKTKRSSRPILYFYKNKPAVFYLIYKHSGYNSDKSMSIGVRRPLILYSYDSDLIIETLMRFIEKSVSVGTDLHPSSPYWVWVSPKSLIEIKEHSINAMIKLPWFSIKQNRHDKLFLNGHVSYIIINVYMDIKEINNENNVVITHVYTGGFEYRDSLTIKIPNQSVYIENMRESILRTLSVVSADLIETSFHILSNLFENLDYIKLILLNPNEIKDT